MPAALLANTVQHELRTDSAKFDESCIAFCLILLFPRKNLVSGGMRTPRATSRSCSEWLCRRQRAIRAPYFGHFSTSSTSRMNCSDVCEGRDLASVTTDVATRLTNPIAMVLAESI
jgi:hypothetical protein